MIIVSIRILTILSNSNQVGQPLLAPTRPTARAHSDPASKAAPAQSCDWRNAPDLGRVEVLVPLVSDVDLINLSRVIGSWLCIVPGLVAREWLLLHIKHLKPFTVAKREAS